MCDDGAAAWPLLVELLRPGVIDLSRLSLSISLSLALSPDGSGPSERGLGGLRIRPVLLGLVDAILGDREAEVEAARLRLSSQV